MWHLFFLLLLSFFIGLVCLYSIIYIRDVKRFDFWISLGQFIVRLFVGAIFSIVIALAVHYPWVIWVSIGAVGFLSNYWMAWLDKKRG
jgi:hypothetical protein